MKALGAFLGLVFGLALLAGLLAGGYFLFRYVADVFATLEPTVATLTAIASVVALLCAIIVAGGLKTRSQKDQSVGTCVEKTRLYEQLLSFCGEQLQGQKSTEELAADSALINLRQLLTLHGSPKVITAYMNLRKLAGQEGMPGDESHDLLKNLLVEMRADIGRRDSNINKNDLLDLLLGRH